MSDRTDSTPRGDALRFAGLVVGALALAVVAWMATTGAAEDPAFDLDRAELLDAWNEAALAEHRPGLIIREFQWTDEEAGVFGFAFSETMSLLGRVDGTPLDQVEELAFVGSRPDDGLDAIVGGMDLVIAVTEPRLDAGEREAVLAELSMIGTVPADPDGRVTAGSTRYRAAADPPNGVLGIGAVPAAADD